MRLSYKISLIQSIIRKRRPVAFEEHLATEPLCRYFGRTRGKAIDRYYIEKFLQTYSAVIQGVVLEVANSMYTHQFGTAVKQARLLHVDNVHGKSDVVGDLSKPSTIPDSVADCFICTQTLQCVPDIKTALNSCVKLLKPNGQLLLTTSGIGQVSISDMDEVWGDNYRILPMGFKHLIEEMQDISDYEVISYGNLAAALGLLKGIAVEEWPDIKILDQVDVQYPVIIGVRIKRN